MSNAKLLGAASLIAFVSALGGALLALRLDDPDTIEVPIPLEVEVERVAPDPMPTEAQIEQLWARYVDLGADGDRAALGIIDEIWHIVCTDGATADEVGQTFAFDLTIAGSALDAFVADVDDTCHPD